MDFFLRAFPPQLESLSAEKIAGFPLDVKLCTPVNSSPYSLDWDLLVSLFGEGDVRKRLLAALEAAIGVARRSVEMHCLLIGGSFTRREIPAPGDIDCVAYYSRHAGDGSAVPDLAGLQDEFRKSGIDMRFVPVDVNPAVAVKLTSYFTMLYLTHKDGESGTESDPSRHRGILLLTL